MQNQLFLKSENQNGRFIYPVSDTVFITAFKDGELFNFVADTFIRNNQGIVIQQKGGQWIGSNYYSWLFWKEDHLILGAKDLLGKGQAIEALSAFRKAYDQNPKHFYLANFIQHLEFILSPDYESLKSSFSTYAGQYGDLKFQIEDGRIYYTDQQGLIFQLLPLAEDMFMVPSIYNLQIQILKESGIVTGFRCINRNGDDELFARTS